jgi:hypothetical protein
MPGPGACEAGVDEQVTLAFSLPFFELTSYGL